MEYQVCCNLLLQLHFFTVWKPKNCECCHNFHLIVSVLNNYFTRSKKYYSNYFPQVLRRDHSCFIPKNGPTGHNNFCGRVRLKMPKNGTKDKALDLEILNLAFTHMMTLEVTWADFHQAIPLALGESVRQKISKIVHQPNPWTWAGSNLPHLFLGANHYIPGNVRYVC